MRSGDVLSRVRGLLADHRVRVLLVIAALIGGYFLVKAVLPEIDLQDILDEVAAALGDWTYLIVGAFAFLETGAFVGLVAPGETMVILAGAVAGVGETSVVITLAIVWFCAWAGDSVSFMLGRRLGKEFVMRHGPRIRITPERFKKVEDYFRRHGGSTILIGRFVGLVRALAPFVAGSSGMQYRGFVPFSILGTGLWAATFTLVGYFASRSLDQAAEIVGQGTFLFGSTVAVIVVLVVVVRYLRQQENRQTIVETMERKALLRPLLFAGRRLKPQAVFLWRRLTPGGLGLELTSMLAALAVGLFVFIGYAILVNADPSATNGDHSAGNVVFDLRMDWLTEVAKIASDIGSGYVVYPAALLGALALAIRRRFPEALVIVVGTATIAFGVPEFKEIVARPRPAGALIELPGNESYPSGHAAQSTVYVALALLFAREFDPRLHIRRITPGAALIFASLLLAAAIGLSRVYLGVHYLSDVSGGWAFGVSAFALFGSIAMVVTHLRKNGGGDRPVLEDSA